jgi:flagellar basal-body rod protein FlgB
MPLIPNPTSSLIEHVLRFRNQRHDVLASNIANASTPGYRGFELVLGEQLGSSGVGLQRSSSRHMSGGESSLPATGDAQMSRDRARLDGNNVSLDAEFMKLTENRLIYQTAFELYEGMNGLSRIAREIR